MIRVLLSERIQKTASKLPVEVREKASKAIADVGSAFGDPHRHRGLGLRKLAKRSYEIRVHLQWRVVFIHDEKALIAYDVMNHDEVSLWLKGQRK
jgi:mRNA-degrading endonuclease RelE of RelBE toxin-antitoxin system